LQTAVEFRHSNRQLEAFEAQIGGLIAHRRIAEARIRDERDQIRMARDPHCIKISWDDETHCPLQLQFFLQAARASAEAAPVNDSQTDK
jgi:hypothetical protein